MFQWLSGSVRRRVLVTFISLVLVLAVIIIGLTGFLSSSLVDNLVEENSFALVNSRAQMVDLWKQERMQELKQLANSPILETGDWGQIESFLQRQIQEAPDYYLIFFVATPDGEYSTTLQRSAGNVGDRSYFAQAMAGKTVISEPVFSRSTGEKIVVVATPIWNELKTEITGVLGLSMGLEGIYGGVSELSLGYPGGELFMVDSDGYFLVHPDPELIMTKRIQDYYPPWDIYRDQTSGTFTYTVNGTEYRTFFSSFPNEDWYVIAQIPTAYFKEPIRRLLTYLLLVGVVCVFLVFRMGLWFSKSVTDPIMELKEIFKRGSEGDLTVRATVGRTDELGETGASFNRMMDTIGTMTYYDPLTGLPNRQYFMDYLSKSLEKNPVVILALVSIRGLSELKTLLGPETTDEVLIKVAEILTRMGEKDLVVARIAEGEFGVIIPSTARGVLRVVDQLDGLLSQPLHMTEQKLQIRLFSGITISEPDESVNSEVFYQQARAALYEAERSLNEQLKLYNPTTHHLIMDRLRFQTEIRAAFELEQFTVFYQPIIDLKSRTIVGKEALIRWRHPVRGLLAPGEFLDAVEQGGFIEQIGEYMLETVCTQHREWLSQGMDLGWVAVNISANHFRSPHFPALVRSVLTNHYSDSLLRLEITEEAMLSPTPQVLHNFHELRTMGVPLAIDDFGTAYSSLEYLVRYPVEIIKIDRTFIHFLDQDERSQALVRAIVGMGHNLSMTVVAEGVERKEQMQLLCEMGCNEAQGYYFARPIPWEEYPREASKLMERLGRNGFCEAKNA